MKILFLNLLLVGTITISYAQGHFAVPISTDIFYGEQDEWIHLKISDVNTGEIWYDTLATVTADEGFSDTVYLDSATYKCEIIDMGANVSMPKIKLDNDSYAQWGYPDYEYYLFSLPATSLGLSNVLENKQLNIFPNPCFNQINIEIPEPMLPGTLTLLDYHGRLLQSIDLKNQNKLNVDVTDLTKGVYFIQVNTEKNSIRKKLVVN